MLQNATPFETLSRNQRPDLLTSLMNMSPVLRHPCDMNFSRSSSDAPRLPSFLQMLQRAQVLRTFKVQRISCLCHAQTTSEPSKWSRACGAFCILTSTCSSWHGGVHSFSISTSESAPKLRCALSILTWTCASRHKGVHFFDIATF